MFDGEYEADFGVCWVGLDCCREEGKWSEKWYFGGSFGTNLRPLFIWSNDYRECSKAFYMNVAGHMLGCLTVSEGGPCSIAVDVKLILQGALLTNAHGVILAHNHPSGNLQPSTPDKFMTEKVEKALSIMDMKLLDHLIVTRGGYFSFVDEGVM